MTSINTKDVFENEEVKYDSAETKFTEEIITIVKSSEIKKRNCNTVLLLLKLMYFCWFAGSVFSNPYIANYLSTALNITFDESAFIFGLAPFVAVIARLAITYFADLSHSHKMFLLVSAAIHLASWECLLLLNPRPKHVHVTDSTSTPPHRTLGSDATFWLALVLVASLMAFGSATNALMDALTFDAMGDATKEDYGRQRMWGTFGCMIFSIVSGFGLNHLGDISDSYWIRIHFNTAFKVLASICTLFLGKKLFTKSPTSKDPETSPPFLPRSPENDTTQTNGDPESSLTSHKQLLLLLFNRRVLLFLFSFLTIGCLIGFNGNYQGVFMEAELRATQAQIGVAFAVATFSEFVMFQFSGALTALIGSDFSLLLSFFGFFLRFLGYFFVKSAWVVLPIELFHSVTFALSWSTSTSIANAIAPKGLSATLQGLAGGLYQNAGVGVGCIIGGNLYGVIGGRETYLVFACTGLISCLAYGVIMLCNKRLIHEKKDEINGLGKE